MNVQKDVYNKEDIVEAEIIILNKGDIPDIDTVLIYYLTDLLGNKFGVSREQFQEVPIGKNILNRNIKLPTNALYGEWRFNVEYYTLTQPTIFVYDTFSLKESLISIKTIKTARNPLVIIFIILFLAITYLLSLRRRINLFLYIKKLIKIKK